MVFEKRPIIAPITGCMSRPDVYSASGEGTCVLSPRKASNLPAPTHPASPIASYEPRHPGCLSFIRSIPFLGTSPVGPSSVQPPYTACRAGEPVEGRLGGWEGTSYLTNVLSTRHRCRCTQRTVAGRLRARQRHQARVRPRGFGRCCSGKIVAPWKRWRRL